MKTKMMIIVVSLGLGLSFLSAAASAEATQCTMKIKDVTTLPSGECTAPGSFDLKHIYVLSCHGSYTCQKSEIEPHSLCMVDIVLPVGAFPAPRVGGEAHKNGGTIKDFNERFVVQHDVAGPIKFDILGFDLRHLTGGAVTCSVTKVKPSILLS